MVVQNKNGAVAFELVACDAKVDHQLVLSHYRYAYDHVAKRINGKAVS